MSVNTVYEVVDGIKSIEVVLDDKKREEKKSPQCVQHVPIYSSAK